MLEKTSYPESVVRRCSLKKMLLKISQILYENTCAGISFLISYEFREMFKNILFIDYFQTSFFKCPINMPRTCKTKCEKNDSNDILITYLYILTLSQGRGSNMTPVSKIMILNDLACLHGSNFIREVLK